MERRGILFVTVLLAWFIPALLNAAIVTADGEVLGDQPAEQEEEPAAAEPAGPAPAPAAAPAEEEKEEAPITLPSEWPSARSRQFGLGFILGSPTGLSFRWFFHEMQGIDALAAWSWGYDHHSRMLFQADYLFRFYVVPIPKGDGALYTGGGLRIGAYDKERWDDRDPDWRFLVGLRVPGGLIYQVHSFPIEVLLELAFVMDILPDFWPGFDIGIGLRFCF